MSPADPTDSSEELPGPAAGAGASDSAATVAGEQQSSGEDAERIPEPLDQFQVSWTDPEGEPHHGPLSVLWKLIESYRIDIFEVSLLRISEDFLEFLSRASELQIELASSFAVMASQLLFYKSRALLPDPGFEDAEEEPRLPPELVQQLLEYRRFQLAADRLREMDNLAAGMLTRPPSPAATAAAEGNEWLEVSINDLIQAYSNMLRRLQEGAAEERRFEIQLEEVSVEDRIEALRELFKTAQELSFDELFESVERMNRAEIIATFLALLELTRMREIVIRQRVNFGEIRIFKRSALVH
ncbi:MAG: segregation/condensation protein A [Leptospirales bacterium]|nr:segregation/condensation protein A [Leptospirales bacterium]